jgi:2-iminobutanoate/2-iminopropanoate deaminase
MKLENVIQENRAPWPYAQAVVVRGGDLMICSGQVAFNADRDIVGRGDLRAQARQAFENLKATVEKANASMNDIVHITVYLTDTREFPRLGEIARKYLRDPFPAMTLIGVKELAWPDLMVEFQAIVGVPRRND